MANCKQNQNSNHVCGRCERDKGSPKKFSYENDMIPSRALKKLQDLTQVEEMLISRAFPVINVYTKPFGGQRSYKGHVITLPQDVQQLVGILPRYPDDLPVIVFTVNRKGNCSKDFLAQKYFKNFKICYFKNMLND